MSGYFSRIAKQGGARFATGERRRGVSMRSQVEDTFPLEREETVMISPDERASESRLRSPDNAESRTKGGDKPRAEQGERSTKSVESRSQRSRRPSNTAPVQPIVEEVKLVDAERPRSAARVESPAASFSGGNDDTSQLEPVNKTQKPNTKEKRQTDTANSEIPEKEFFERTSEIIQGREAEPSVVQTILIQEVQEWIAAGRIPTDEIMTDADADRQLEQSDETQSIIERKPGVVRIGDSKRPDVASDAGQELSPSTMELNEQNFEISIGSISVVIDGEEPVSQPAPTAAATPRAPSSASPRTSRLSRHYL
jgi:hypothetical protein